MLDKRYDVVVDLAQSGQGIKIGSTSLSVQNVTATSFLSGPAGQATVGTVTTLPSGAQATVTNSGTPSNAIFNFGIPTGASGNSVVGPGISPGGTPGQYLAKNSSSDFDTKWVSAPTINDLAGKTITSATGIQFVLTVTDAGNLVTTLVGGVSGNKYRATYAATY